MFDSYYYSKIYSPNKEKIIQDIEDYKKNFLPKILEHPVLKKEEELIRNEIVQATNGKLIEDLAGISAQYAFSSPKTCKPVKYMKHVKLRKSPKKSLKSRHKKSR